MIKENGHCLSEYRYKQRIRENNVRMNKESQKDRKLSRNIKNENKTFSTYFCSMKNVPIMFQ